MDLAEEFPAFKIIKYYEDEYRVFYNDAQIKCFICHQYGHTTQYWEYNIKMRGTPKCDAQTEVTIEDKTAKNRTHTL